MAVVMTTPMSEIDKIIAQQIKFVDDETIKVLSYLGELCVTEARDRSQSESWYDQTGNLRSSIGYIITQNGDIVSMSSFGSISGGAEGSSVGQNYSKTIASKFNNGFSLIIVAGMEYAALVEAMDNKVVLASAELLARRELNGFIAKLNNKLSRQVK